MGRVAIIGWGSLIWDLDILADKVKGAWRLGEGPELPVEFARISPKRKGALALCLDPVHGQPCRTSIIASTRADCTEAILDLAARERADPGHIGALCTRTGIRKSASAEIMQTIESWSQRFGWSCAVWTDLPPNFADTRGEAFSVPRAIAYLKTLEGDRLTGACRYIHLAPEVTDTPLRRALALDPWWQEQVAALEHGPDGAAGQ